MMPSLRFRPLRGALAVLASIASLLVPLQADALLSGPDAQLKIAPELLATLSTTVQPIVPWARLLNGELLV